MEDKAKDCPVCGKKEGAYMTCTIWDHRIEVCSFECGDKLDKRKDK